MNVDGKTIATPLEANRREVFAGLLAFVATGPMLLSACSKAAGDPKLFFSADNRAFLASFVDSLIPATDTPGAKAANVHVNLGRLMMTWASAETRTKMGGALDLIRKDLDERTKARFDEASPEQRQRVLASMDAEAFGAPDGERWADYKTLKALAVRLYYTSEIGATQELRYDPVPGGYIGDLPFKTGDRAWAL